MTTQVIQTGLNTVLFRFIDKVQTYPISVGKLLNLAKRSGQPKEVVEFYKSFESSLIFSDREDLAGCTEQVEIMRDERKDMPQELQIAPEEY